MITHPLQILSLEPNTDLRIPYVYFPLSYHFHTHRSLSLRLLPSLTYVPNLVTLSCSFPIEKMVDFLWQLKSFSADVVIPLIFVVDWSQPLLQLPGTTWDGKVGLIHSLSSEEEVSAALNRVLPSSLALSNCNRTVKEAHAKKY